MTVSIQKEKRRFWSESEIEALRSAYSAGNVDLNALASRFNRTKYAVALKANDIGVTAQRGHADISKERKTKINLAGQAGFREWLKLPGSREKLGEGISRHHRQFGHPRGFLGGHHTESAKARIAAAHTGRKLGKDSIRKAVLSKIQKYGRAGFCSGRGSWKSGWKTVGGRRCFFRSSWELEYARHLESLKQAGEILNWEFEPKTFPLDLGETFSAYAPDFLVQITSTQHEWREVKGWMDSRSTQKLAAMAEQHPEQRVVIIGKEWFQNLKK